MKAIILAGGLGERLRPLTLNTPKPLLLIKGKPIVQRSIENLKKHGIKDIILSIGYKSEKIKDYFLDGEKFGVNISYNVEESPLGTGGAVKEIVKKYNIKKDFVLVWADNLTDVNIGQLIAEHEINKGLITMTLTLREDLENFGVVKLDNNKIIGFVEKPKRLEAPSNLINSGVFIVHPDALNVLPEGRSSIERECFEKIASEGRMFGFKHTGYWFPTDRLELYNYAEQHLKDE